MMHTPRLRRIAWGTHRRRGHPTAAHSHTGSPQANHCTGLRCDRVRRCTRQPLARSGPLGIPWRTCRPSHLIHRYIQRRSRRGWNRTRICPGRNVAQTTRACTGIRRGSGIHQRQRQPRWDCSLTPRGTADRLGRQPSRGCTSHSRPRHHTGPDMLSMCHRPTVRGTRTHSAFRRPRGKLCLHGRNSEGTADRAHTWEIECVPHRTCCNRWQQSTVLGSFRSWCRSISPDTGTGSH